VVAGAGGVMVIDWDMGGPSACAADRSQIAEKITVSAFFRS
jgi:hypothetical protein